MYFDIFIFFNSSIDPVIFLRETEQVHIKVKKEGLLKIYDKNPALFLDYFLIFQEFRRTVPTQTSSALSLAEKLTQTPDADIGWVLYAEILEKSENNPKKALGFYHKFLEDLPSSLLYEPVRFHVRKLQDQLKS
jgi:hypothetical protein